MTAQDITIIEERPAVGVDPRRSAFMQLLRDAFPDNVAVKVPQAAKAVGLSESGMRHLVNHGVIPSVLRPTSGTLRKRPLIDLRVHPSE